MRTHLRGEIPEQVRLKKNDVLRMSNRCQKCHQQEYAEWAAGAHAATYKEIFLDDNHNHREHLMDDCLRCHGMHFSGGIRDLVTPLDTKGPWKLRDPNLAEQPAIPCLACHQMHHEGTLLMRSAVKPLNPGPGQEIFRPSLALFDRREMDFVALGRLPLPTMHAGDRTIYESRRLTANKDVLLVWEHRRIKKHAFPGLAACSSAVGMVGGDLSWIG